MNFIVLRGELRMCDGGLPTVNMRVLLKGRPDFFLRALSEKALMLFLKLSILAKDNNAKTM